MIQVGIIGSGFIGPAHIEALRRLGGLNVVALCDSSLAVAGERRCSSYSSCVRQR